MGNNIIGVNSEDNTDGNYEEGYDKTVFFSVVVTSISGVRRTFQFKIETEKNVETRKDAIDLFEQTNERGSQPFKETFLARARVSKPFCNLPVSERDELTIEVRPIKVTQRESGKDKFIPEEKDLVIPMVQ